MAVGKVWLVGAGPGDPGLITVRGRDVLARAEVVLVDALAHPALLEYCPGADIQPVGKRYAEESTPQDEINRRLVELARRGKRVVRLKGGDPMLFARGAEEALALQAAGIPFEIVPGVSSPVAASAYAGIPLTHRDVSGSVTFITGSDRAGKEWSDAAWKKLATATDTVCILMGMRRIGQLAAAMLAGGRSPETPVAVVQWGARPAQRVVTSTLAHVADEVHARGLKNPAVILVGEVVALRERLAWYDREPLFGRGLVLFRAAEQAAESARLVRERGAEPLIVPVIEIAAPPDAAPLRAALGRLASYEWVLFTSANGVTRFFEALFASGRDARALASCKLGVVGPKTAAALERYGVRPELTAEQFVGEGLAESLFASGKPGPVLLARALVARDALPGALQSRGFDVEVVPVYETRPLGARAREKLLGALDAGHAHAALFTSSSTVRETLEALGPDAAAVLSRLTVASIGPVTSRTLEGAGIRIDVQAEHYTVEGLLDALERYYAAQSPSR